jgi:hypothetical protein
MLLTTNSNTGAIDSSLSRSVDDDDVSRRTLLAGESSLGATTIDVGGGTGTTLEVAAAVVAEEREVRVVVLRLVCWCDELFRVRRGAGGGGGGIGDGSLGGVVGGCGDGAGVRCIGSADMRSASIWSQ